MKLSRLKIALGAVVLALSPVTLFAGAGLAGTPHDFTTANPTGNPPVGANSVAVGVCTFCHTPHKAISTQLLWNHTLSTNTTFSWTDATNTMAGTPFATFGPTYKGPTAKCLSCHDGSVAIGDIAWFAESSRTGVDSINATTIGGTDTHSVGFGGSMNGNHPVAMPYPYLQDQNTYNGKQTGAKYARDEWVAEPSAPIRLFNDAGGGDISAGPVATKTGIECSTCHDPHNKASVEDMFLRGKLTGNSKGDGYLCLQCHIK